MQSVSFSQILSGDDEGDLRVIIKIESNPCYLRIYETFEQEFF